MFQKKNLEDRKMPEKANTLLQTTVLRRYFLLFSACLISGAIHEVGNYKLTFAVELPLSDGDEVLYFLA